ncbi:GreA/GreB family elongation factor [Bacillus sp. CGMCC 1.16607]|uniref:GreA/GreB family elongation factor n=1 Tax=Bacillus sp. CGMCC 1.16607 TaxID=3351842 RepID=UPI00364279A1
MNHNLKTSDHSDLNFYYQQIDYIEKNKQELVLQWQDHSLPQAKLDRFFDLYLLHLNEYVTSCLNQEVPKMDKVFIGSSISVKYLDDDEEEHYTICFPEEIDPDYGKISIFSPIGRQLLLKNLDEEISLEIPTGTLRIKIVDIKHFPQ